MGKTLITPDKQLRMWAIEKALELVLAAKMTVNENNIGKFADNVYGYVTGEEPQKDKD